MSVDIAYNKKGILYERKVNYLQSKSKSLVKFCSSGYEAWDRVIKRDIANKYKAGRDRSAPGQAYWESFNNEVVCILGIHNFLKNHVLKGSSQTELAHLEQFKQF